MAVPLFLALIVKPDMTIWTLDYPKRYIKVLFEHHENYVEYCRPLVSKEQKKKACKNFCSIENRTLLAKDKESVDEDTLVLSLMPPDELHHLTGPFDKLYKCVLTIYPKISDWADKFCDMKKYHGGTFIGGDCKKLLGNIDELARMMIDDQCAEALRFIGAFRALEAVRTACFGKDLKPDWKETLEKLKNKVKDLVDDEDIPMTCTLKFYILFFHVKKWCEMEKRGLGNVSTQAGESMHGRFERYLVTKNNDPLLAR